MSKEQQQKKQQKKKIVRIISTPIRFLGKARDMYVRSITKCGYSMNYSNPVDAAGRFTALPRSYSATTSTRSDSEDYAELMRAASARTLVNRIDMDLVLKQQQQQQHRNPVGSNGLPKSISVGMGRIDEDKPYELGEAVVPDLYPRSRSYAVGNTTLVLRS